MPFLNEKPSSQLKIVREILGLTQAELGERLGFKWTKIKDIEIGKQKLTPEIALDIEKKFHFCFKWLLTGEGEMWPDSCVTIQKGNVTVGEINDLQDKLFRIIKEGDATKETAVRALLTGLDPGEKAKRAG